MKNDPRMRVYEDAFNMLAGRLIGEGCYRKVFECKLRPELVVKVEEEPEDGYREFHNVAEAKFWKYNEQHTAVSKWLAPIIYSSPDGFILLQKKVRMAHDTDELPRQLPAFLTDLKVGNFGWLGNQLVCIDYALHIHTPNVRLKKADWW